MAEEKVLNDAVLCYLIRGEEVLLAWKTRNIGKDKWNGYGGGIEERETSRAAAIREIKQEGGIIVLLQDLKRVGEVSFHNTKVDGEEFICKVKFFLVYKWEGIPKDSDDGEMVNPAWFNQKRLPEQMIPGDKFFLPYIFSGKKIKGYIWYGSFQKELLREPKIEEVDSLPED